MRALLTVSLSLIACGAPTPTSASNRDCGGCHPTQFDALRASRHGHAASSELFRALRATASPQDQTFCDQCHRAHDVESEEGAGCVTCHQATGNRGVMNARLVFDATGPMRGPIADPTATPAHASRRDDFIRSSDLCGTCHEVSGPGGFVETPYTEWASSSAPRADLQCADCHMASAPGDPTAPRPRAPAAHAGPVRALSDHAFVGPDDPRAPELLSRAALVTVSVISRGAAGAEVSVRVTNRNVAHALPSGARFAREVWIELSTTDAAGVWRVLSGGDDDTLPDPMRVDLGDRIVRAGAFALPTQSDAPEVRAIPAAESRDYRYVLPPDAISVRARLRYRRNTRALRRALGLADDPTPVIDLSETTTVL